MPWHDYLALALVAAAAVLVMVRAYRFFYAKPTAGCGSGCGSCPASSEQSHRKSLLAIGSAPDRAK